MYKTTTYCSMCSTKTNECIEMKQFFMCRSRLLQQHTAIVVEMRKTIMKVKIPIHCAGGILSC